MIISTTIFSFISIQKLYVFNFESLAFLDMLSRPGKTIGLNLNICCTIQLALELNSPKEIPNAIDYFKKSIVAFRVHREKDLLVFDPNRKIPVMKIPNNIKSLQASAEYVANHPYNYEDCFGQIAANDHQVVVDISHTMGDGAFFCFLVQNYGKPPNPPLDHLPNFFNDGLEKKIEAAPIDYIFTNDPYLTRFHSRATEAELKNNPYIDSNGFSFFQYFDKRLPASAFTTYNPSKRAPEHLSEAFWIAHYFAACSQENKLLPFFKINTIINSRQFLDRPANFYDCGKISNFSPSTKVFPNMTIKEMGQKMRENLKDMIKKGYQFSFLKRKYLSGPEPPGIYMELTNMGPLKIRKPIVDAWASLKMHSRDTPMTSLMSFSVDDGKRNDFVTRFRYTPTLMSANEAIRFSNSIDYFLKNISFDRKIEDVYHEMNGVFYS